MKLARHVFESLVSNDGPDISFSLYHECLHLIAYTHAKVLSIPRNKFIDPASPMNNDDTVSVQFIPHWQKHLLLPLFLCLIRLYIKPQLWLTDHDYEHISAAFDGLPTSNINDTLGITSKHVGRHLHII